MQCQNCSYALWNLKDRTCPECGDAFEPSHFDFRPGTVRFMCPHCQQDYYGTDERGHLVPRSFDCVSCHQPVTMDEMVLLPAEGVPESRTQMHKLPWNHRRKHGTLRAWWKTTKLAMVGPSEIMLGREDSSSLGAAWGYFAFTFGLIMLAGVIMGTIVFGILVLIMSNAGNMPPGFIGSMALMQLIVFGFAVVLAVVFVVAWGLVTHGALRLSGKTGGTIRTTFHALLYSSGPNVLNAIPCLNNLPIGSVWWLVSAILMVRRGHEVSGLRATFAVLLFPILAIAGAVAAYIALIIAIFSAAATNAGGVTSTQIESLSLAAQARAAEVGTGWDHTDHALLLLAEDRVDTWDYISFTSSTSFDDIVLYNGTTLEEFTNTASYDSADIVEQIAPLPTDVVAHRVGDFVFTWHGIDAANPPPGLWLIVEHDLNDVGRSKQDASAIAADGTITTLRTWDLLIQLELQNKLRAQHGLPMLPDPTTITQQEPATAGP